jgi:predicted transposase YbfD/YdcC
MQIWKRGNADENVWVLREINENLTSSRKKIEANTFS